MYVVYRPFFGDLGDHLCLKNQFFASFMMQTFEISAFAEMLFSFRYSD